MKSLLCLLAALCGTFASTIPATADENTTAGLLLTECAAAPDSPQHAFCTTFIGGVIRGFNDAQTLFVKRREDQMICLPEGGASTENVAQLIVLVGASGSKAKIFDMPADQWVIGVASSLWPCNATAQK